MILEFILLVHKGESLRLGFDKHSNYLDKGKEMSLKSRKLLEYYTN